MPSSAPTLGTVVMGELSLEEQLGSAVFRARRTRDGRELSMRIVHPRTSQEAAEFLALAATASRVRHPALASVEAYGRLDSERCYIANELIGGQRLDEWADAVGIPPLAQVVELVRRLCVGLQAAARAGVVHDAIHARNVRVQAVPSGSNARMPVKLLGLGVPALLFNYQHEPDALRFMAPEQLQVLSRSELPATFRCSAQMNVYSLGALLYYLATGGAPFAGMSAPELLAAQASAPLVPPVRINPQITAGLNAVVMRALELDPSDRFASAAELGEALAGVFGSVAPPRKRERSSVQPVGEDLFGPEPPTFRTSVSSIAELERAVDLDSRRTSEVPALAIAHDDTPERDKPTLPPAPPSVAVIQTQSIGEMRDSISGVAPIGLFSSSPPHLRQAGDPSNAAAPKPTPLAAFSEPPRVVSLDAPPGSNPPPASTAQPSSQLESTPRSPSVPPMEPRGKQRPFAWPVVALPLVAAICLFVYFGVRMAVEPDEAEAVAKLPAPTVVTRAALPAPPPATQAPEPRPTAPQPAALPGASAPLRPYINTAELEDDATDEAPEREASDGPRQRPRRVAQAPRRSSAANHAPPQAPAPAPVAQVAPVRAVAPLVDEHIEESTPPAVDTRLKPDDYEASASVVIPPPDPVAPAPAPKPEPASTVSLPLTAKVRIDDVEVRGSLPKSHVRHAAERLVRQLKRCYEQAAQAAGHNGFGELIVAVDIDERGRARSPRVQGAGLPRLEGCVTDTLQHLATGRVPDTGTVSATWKIVFMP